MTEDNQDELEWYADYVKAAPTAAVEAMLYGRQNTVRHAHAAIERLHREIEHEQRMIAIVKAEAARRGLQTEELQQ